MNIDLALILTLLTVVTGIVVLFDKVSWKTADRDYVSTGQATLVEYSRAFFPVLLFVLVIRSFVFEPFRIPSGSMQPTLYNGDFIFVTKYSYGLRLPVSNTRVLDTGSPERGDVVVFRNPQDPTVNYIKRVIGIPGDVVRYERHNLTINGESIPYEKHPEWSAASPRFVEQLGEREHEILITNELRTLRDGQWTVPEGQFFMMGDNRDNSQDSRVIGLVPESHLVGEAVRIWLHFVPWNMPKWERIGNKIQ
ncbi:MAG: signal peptidase I [Pseudomonadota bacterium]